MRENNIENCTVCMNKGKHIYVLFFSFVVCWNKSLWSHTAELRARRLPARSLSWYQYTTIIDNCWYKTYIFQNFYNFQNRKSMRKLLSKFDNDQIQRLVLNFSCAIPTSDTRFLLCGVIDIPTHAAAAVLAKRLMYSYKIVY